MPGEAVIQLGISGSHFLPENVKKFLRPFIGPVYFHLPVAEGFIRQITKRIVLRLRQVIPDQGCYHQDQYYFAQDTEEIFQNIPLTAIVCITLLLPDTALRRPARAAKPRSSAIPSYNCAGPNFSA